MRTWLRETLQNSYSLEYLTSQSAGLFTRGSKVAARIGDVLCIDGEDHTVRQTVGGRVMCSVGAEDDADDWEVLTAEEAAGMLRAEQFPHAKHLIARSNRLN